jgi:hypothetical protein
MRMPTRTSLAAALLAPAAALACGACIEDKVAATYDHAVIVKAHARGATVLFIEPHAATDAAHVASAVGAAARRARGVDPASVRTSIEPLALSFALDARTDATHALRDIERGARLGGLTLSVIKVER